MPNITVEGPEIKDLETKRELVKTMTDAAVKAFSLPTETIVVVIKSNSPENVSVGGQLICDKFKS